MRFLVFGLLFLTAIYISESFSIAKRDVKDDLLKNAQELKVLAKKEIDKLKAEGKTLLAAGLEKADKVVLDIESQLKALNPTTEVGKTLLATLEKGLELAEGKLKDEIKKLSGTPVKRDVTEDLSKTISELLTKAKAAIETLQKAGKTELVNGLQKSIKFLMDVETQLKTLKPTTEVGKALFDGLVKLVKQGEAVLEADLKKAQSGSKRDTKDDLLKSANELKDLAKKEIDKLKAEGKTLLAAGLEKADKVVLDIETQLKALNPTTEVGKGLLAVLEKTLEGAEAKLKEEIKKLSGSYFDEDLKNQLLIEAEKLKKLASAELEKLKAEGKTALAAGLKKAEDVVLDVENQLKKLNPTTEVGKVALNTLEVLLKKAETTLEDEIKKLSGTPVKRDTQEELMKTVTELLAKAHAAVETLQKTGKTELVNGLQKSIKFLMDVETQLKTLKPTTEVGKALFDGLVKLVKQGEAVLEADLKKAQSGSKRDTKDDLLKSANELKDLAKKEIDKLKAEGKTALAAGLEKADKVVLDIETQLKALNPTTEVGKALLAVLEKTLEGAEGKLREEIKKLSGTPVKRDVTEDLSKTISELLTKAKAAIETLQKAGKTELVNGLEKSVKFLVDVENQLKSLKPTTEVGKALLEGLQKLVKQGEAVLEADLKKAQSGF